MSASFEEKSAIGLDVLDDDATITLKAADGVKVDLNKKLAMTYENMNQ